MIKTRLLIFCFIIGFFHKHTVDADDAAAFSEKSVEEPTVAALLAATLATKATAIQDADTAKDKRQVDAKATQLYPNHRPEALEDDPENGQETIYGPKPNQFLIRPISPQQQQQQQQQQPPGQLEENQETLTQLRNYPATIRPQSQQLLEQSQEIQHFAYLQDVNRNQLKAVAPLPLRPSKLQSTKSVLVRSPPQTFASAATNSATEEAEQRYAYAVQAQVPPLPQPHHFKPSIPYRLPQAVPPTAPRQAQPLQLLQPQQPQQYQVIPEEQFLKLLEDELQARAYQEAQNAQQQQRPLHSHPDAASKVQPPELAERSSNDGLGNYRQRISVDPSGDYIPFVPRHRAGPKYLPLPDAAQQPHPIEAPAAPPPPRGAYFKPTHLTYKTSLPNHPLAKSSLEREIEKLLAANKPSAEALQIVEDTNEPPAGFVGQHRQPPPARHQSKPLVRPKPAYTSPNTLVDANNQPFVPSLFQFQNYPQPAPIHPTQAAPNVGPAVYPTNALQPAQPSQFFYQEAQPAPISRPYRSKQYGAKIGTSSIKAARQKEAAAKLQSSDYDFEREPSSQTGPVQFQPSPEDSSERQAAPRPRTASTAARRPQAPPPAANYPAFALPAAAPSQSSIYVSQGTGVTTHSRPIHQKPVTKTAEDVRQLKLPQPGGKPLTQAEFQALVDAGYPVTAVPVPVPVPYEQFIKDNPEHRSHPLDYGTLMRLALAQRHPQLHKQHALALAPSEPSGKIVPPPSGPKTDTSMGADGITYLRPIAPKQKRRPRDEKDTAVEGKMEAN